MITFAENIFAEDLTEPKRKSTLAPVSEITKAAAMLGRRGGLAKSARKAAAVRANGKLGGRPPKKKSSRTNAA